MRPIWTFDDGNASILYPDISRTHDLYGIPNVVEVVYSDGENSYYAKVENNDPNSPTSIGHRGRRIVKRVTNPEFPSAPSAEQIREYAERLLKELYAGSRRSADYCGSNNNGCSVL